ncbi:MAG: hypothetical protein GXO86_08465 [Chlorobi bacterium]|nr:hypothetical protein [Chlorobiota bacterium]
MRQLVSILFILLSVMPGKAQDKGSFIGIHGGLSIPVGEYKAKNLENGCFTLPGFNIGIEGSWYFKKYIGIGGQFGFNLHPVDVRALGYEKVNADPFLMDLTIRSEPYQIITGAAGLFTKWDFLKILSLSGKLLGGIMAAKTPYQLYKPIYFQTGPDYYEITSSKDRNFAMIVGAGLTINVSSCIAFRAGGEFIYSRMVFGFITASGTRYENRKISFINTTLGLIILL